MRFTIIGPAYPLRGGIAHHVYWLHNELSRRGHEVQAISFRRLYPQFLFPGRTAIDDSEQKLEVDSFPALDPMNPLTWLEAFRLIRSFAPDAAVFQWWNPFFSPVMGALARLLKSDGVKVIFECHNVFPHERSLADLPLITFAFAPVDLFITHSNRERELLMEMGFGRKIGVAPLPEIDNFQGAQNRKRDGRTILFFGIVRKYKGLDVLLRAMPKILDKVECELIVSGEFYDSVERYRNLIKELGIERSVNIDDRYAPNEEVAEIFNRADVLVLPYLSATQSGVARVALLNGLPIIASRTGGLSEVVQENFNGLLFPPGDADALAEAIINYFANGLGPSFSMNIRTFGVESEGENIGDLIEAMAQDDL